MKLNEDTFIDINSPKANKRPLKESVGRVLQFSTPVNVNGNSYNIDVDCGNLKYYINQRWSNKDDIRLTKKEYDKLVSQLKWIGFTDGDSKNNKNSVTESKKLMTEKQWNKRVDKKVAERFRNVIMADDYAEMREPVEATKALLQWFADNIEDGEWEVDDIIDDLNMINPDESPDDIFSEAQDDWDDDISNEEHFNFILSEVYDLFDGYDIWIPTLYESIDHCKAEIHDLTDLMEKRTDLSDNRKKSITEEIDTLQSKLKSLQNKCKR